MNPAQASEPSNSGTGARTPALATKLSTVLGKWMEPGGQVAIHTAVVEPGAPTASCQIWARPPGGAWSVRETVDLGGLPLLDLELAILEAGFIYPLTAQATARWHVEADDHSSTPTQMLEVVFPWS